MLPEFVVAAAVVENATSSVGEYADGFAANDTVDAPSANMTAVTMKNILRLNNV
jgi:hypothetical protein